MLKRPSKKDLSDDEMRKITEASAKQTGSMSSPKTYDPNYPVFDTPVNQKVLVYIPNHTVTTESGEIVLRADRFTAHAVKMGKMYGDVRCTGELVNEKLHWDGTCPLCNATSQCWDLYNIQLNEIARSKGIAKDSPEADDLLREDRKRLLNDMAIKAPEKWITFPIVVIDCEEGKTVPRKDANGKISGKPMFYSIRETTYDDKWGKAFDVLDEDGANESGDNNPAGRWAVLNFTYTPKTGQPNKRDSARNLVVSFKTMTGYEQWQEYFDKMTADWTPEIMKTVLVRNAIRSMEEMEEACEEYIKPVREKLAQYEIAGSTGVMATGEGNASAESALANFGATPVGEGDAGAPVAADVGEMPS